jgi:hypothetical protein
MKLNCLEIAKAANLQPGKVSGRELLFTCPRHEDRHPSLCINPDKNAWLCGPCGKSGNAWELAAFILDVSPDNKAKIAGWLREKTLLVDNDNGSKQYETSYVYEDEHGIPLFRAERFKSPGGKTFLLSRADVNGAWISGRGCMTGVRLVPYRLPDWIDKPTVYITEGEKDADNLWMWNLPATTNPMGACKWREEFNPLFDGKQVVILADNDTAGEDHVRMVARNLFGFAKALKIVRLPGLPPKGDVSDWIATGGTLPEFARIIREIPAITQSEIDSWQNQAETMQPIKPKPNAWPILAPEALYGLAGEIVRSIDPYTEADPSSVLIHLLVAFGNVIGANAYEAVQNDLHPARIFAAVIGESSKGRKGTSWSAPREIFRRIDSKWSEERVRSGLSTGEGLIYHVRDEQKKLVPVRNAGRITDYEEEIADSGESDKRLLCLESEFSSMLKIMGREGNSLSGVVREAWDSGNLSTLTRNNPLHSTGAHVSIIGHTTKDELIRNFSATEQCNGFGNRFLWLLSKRSKSLPHGATVPEETMSRLVEKMEKAVNFARSAGRITRDTQANELWEQIYEPLSEGHAGFAGAILNRAEAQVLRMSLLYALLDCSRVIRVEHLQAATAIWDYVEGSVRYIFGDKTGNPVADRILGALRASESGLTDDEIGKLFGYHKTHEKNAALEELHRQNRIARESRETGGRSETIWKVA